MQCEKCQQEMIPINGFLKCIVCGFQVERKADNTEEKTDKPWLFKKGQSGNPNGRPKGSKNYETIYLEAIEQIAKREGKTPKEIEMELILVGINKGIKGEFNYYKDVLDRLLGRAKERVEVSQVEGMNSSQDNIYDE